VNYIPKLTIELTTNWMLDQDLNANMQLLNLTTSYIDRKRNSKVELLNELGREILNRSVDFPWISDHQHQA